ncbi:diaminopimelate epimerase [Sedimentibacter sp. zth1]|uniref:diaminopimelate epimerase n=1 Tax=Sedimentibacter sp. zth1 TaxID=2816908 RepID=UPI001A934591|nr:diaminopimelate epimerase [Sedimentibacter sp. zth1]QSX04890.1 diaminopimelate epimerase [Sedimentibacter sp. zth1]
MEFTKIQGAGNDFIVIDNTRVGLPVSKLSHLAKVLCRRKLSIGADGLIVVERADGNADFKMIFFNSDGSKAEMCGNGARCVARYAYDNKIAWETMNIETPAGEFSAQRISDRIYKIEFMKPSIINLYGNLDIDGINYEYSYIELGKPGVPHALIYLKNYKQIESDELYSIAKKIRYNKIFNKGANVTFYDIIDTDKATIKTYERGVENFTLACGTAASACAVTMFMKNDNISSNISLITDGGELTIDLNVTEDKIINKLYLIGDTKVVAMGKILDEDL